MLYDSTSLIQLLDHPISVSQILEEVASTFKDEQLKSYMLKAEPNLEMVAIEETQHLDRPALLLVLSNCVRITLGVAPPTNHRLDLTSDIRVLKLETSPFERSFDLYSESDDFPLISEPVSTAAFNPFKHDYANEIDLKCYSLFQD
jgi:hypothetical protein